MSRKGEIFRPWTREQVDEMLSLTTTHTGASISKILGRSEMAIRGKMHAIRTGKSITRTNMYHVWSGEDVETLRGMWPNHSSVEIASRIGSTPKSVQRKAEKLELQRSLAYLVAHTGSAYFAYPPELKEVIRLANKIKRKINERQDDRQLA